MCGMRRLVLLAAAAVLLSSGTALAVNRPGWVGEAGKVGSKRHMDILIEGLCNGTHEWRLSYDVPCSGPDDVADDAVFYSKRTPQEAPLRLANGRFVLRRHYDLPDGRDIHWTLTGHRRGRFLVGTFRVHTVYGEGTDGQHLVCDGGLFHWTAHRESFSI